MTCSKMCTYYEVYNRIMTFCTCFNSDYALLVVTYTVCIVLLTNIFVTPLMATSKHIDLDLHATFCI